MCPPDMDIFRRGLLGAAGTVALQPASVSSSAHDPVGLTSAWFVTGAEVTRLTHRWMELENTMMSDPTWAALSREQRRFTPAQVRLDEIDGSKDGAQARQHTFLERLATAPTKNVSGALAKLLVKLGVMIPEGYPHCYQLITDMAQTLAALDCPQCRNRLAYSQATARLLEAPKVWDIHNQV